MHGLAVKVGTHGGGSVKGFQRIIIIIIVPDFPDMWPFTSQELIGIECAKNCDIKLGVSPWSIDLFPQWSVSCALVQILSIM